MMTDRDLEFLAARAAELGAASVAQGRDVSETLKPIFHRALCEHPDDEVRLLELWDKLTVRQMV